MVYGSENETLVMLIRGDVLLAYDKDGTDNQYCQKRKLPYQFLLVHIL